jgi:hypothetical protein
VLMFRLELILIVRAILVLSALNMGAQIVGMTQAPNPIVSGFQEGCADRAKPCWYGIMSGITTLSDALELLEQRGYQVSLHFNPLVGHSSFLATDPVHPSTCILSLIPLANPTSSLRLTCPHLRIGDIFTLFGKPDAVSYPLLYYNSGLNVLPANRLTAFSDVKIVYLDPRSVSPDYGQRWRGFTEWWRYRRMER